MKHNCILEKAGGEERCRLPKDYLEPYEELILFTPKGSDLMRVLNLFICVSLLFEICGSLCGGEIEQRACGFRGRGRFGDQERINPAMVRNKMRNNDLRFGFCHASAALRSAS